jgi:hypothetical protein
VALAQGEHQDVLLLHPFVAASTAPRGGAAGPIMVWYEDCEDATAALDIGLALARMMRTGLLIGVPANRLGTERDIRALLVERIGHLAHQVRIQPVFGAPTEAVIDAARSARAAQIVLAASGVLGSADVLERLLAAIGSKLVLVR